MSREETRGHSLTINSPDAGLNLGGWEDGLMATGSTPFNRTELPNTEVYGNAWDNVWEWGTAERAYKLANVGYKVRCRGGT